MFPAKDAVVKLKLAEVNKDAVDASNPSNLLSTDVENARGSPKPFIVDADIEFAVTAPTKPACVPPPCPIATIIVPADVCSSKPLLPAALTWCVTISAPFTILILPDINKLPVTV